MKKIVASLLILIMTLVCLCACANKDLEIKDTETDVTFHLYAFNGNSECPPLLIYMGHAFFTVRNDSSNDIIVGDYLVKSGTEVSVGAWGQESHWGTWYNLESAYMSTGRYEGVASIAIDLSVEKLVELNAFLKENNTWTPTKNCSYFALEAWNTIANGTKGVIDCGSLVTPAKIYDVISECENVMFTRGISDYSDIGYALDGEFFEFTLVED